MAAPANTNDIATYAQGFEKIIQPFIQDNIPTQAKLLKVLKTNDNVEIFNNAFFVTIRSGYSGGVQTLANDLSKVNTGGAPLSQGSITPAYLAAAMDISDVAIKASRSRRQAIQSDLQFQAQALVKDFAKQANRQYFGDGVGVVAMTSESGGSVGVGTMQIQYPDANVNTYDARTTTYYGTTAGGINGDVLPWQRYFAPGNIIGVGSAGGSATGTIANVATAISGGTQYGTLVFTAAVVTPGSQPLYILDGDADAPGTTEIIGFRGALSEGTQNYMGLARPTMTWQPQIMGTAQNQTISIPNMEQLYYQAYQFAVPGDRYVWFCNRSLYTRFGDYLTALRIEMNRTELTSGWSGYKFQAGMEEIAVMLDYDCPDGDMILVNLDTWTVCEIAPMGFIQDDLLRRPDYITYQKVFSWYTNLACRAPAANGRMVRQTR